MYTVSENIIILWGGGGFNTIFIFFLVKKSQYIACVSFRNALKRATNKKKGFPKLRNIVNISTFECRIKHLYFVYTFKV